MTKFYLGSVELTPTPTTTAATGWINAGDFVDSSASATAQTAGFQAWANAMRATHLARTSGVVGVIPPYRYTLNGPVTLPEMASGMPLTVRAEGAAFAVAAGASNVSLFKTALPSSAADAANKASGRDTWRWYGGSFFNNSSAGNRALELNAAVRMTVDGIYAENFEEQIRARACVHLHLHGIHMKAGPQTLYDVRVEFASGDWTSGTPASAASHALLIDGNSRFYGHAAELAQVRVVDSECTIRDVTFEGGNPGLNIDYANTNTSALEAVFENMHAENFPTVASIQVATPHHVEIDYSFVDGTSWTKPLVKVANANAITMRRTGYPYYGTGYAGNPPFDTTADRDVVWIFRGSGLNKIDPTIASVWAGGLLPNNQGIFASEIASNGGRIFLSHDAQAGAHVITVNAAGKLLIDGTVVGTQT